METLEVGSFELVDILPKYDRLLIQGPSGAGKTTFLRFIACMLARDAAGRRNPAGGSWRAHYLGQEDAAAPRTPVLLRLADAAPRLEDLAPGHDDRHGLLDVLEAQSLERGDSIPRQAWEELFIKGSANLLLDGFDELAGSEVRARFLTVLGDACRHWEIPIVITCRPTETVELARMGFRTPAVEPFGDREIRLFVDRWVKALRADDAERGDRGEDYRRQLLRAVLERPRVRRLAANPEMLTSLCVVHWNQGELSERRSRVYAAVIRRLLVARSALRTERGFSDQLTHRALARLAFAAMASGGKHSILSRGEAVAAVDPVVQRLCPDLDRQERRRRVREWLRFETLGGEVIEDLAGNRVRFLHLPFQEYLAALDLAWRGDGYIAEQDWWPTIKARFEDARWRETVSFFAECLLNDGDHGQQRLDKLLDRVLALGSSNPELTEGAWVVAILGRLLRTLETYDYKPQPEVSAVYRRACDRLLRIFTVEGASKIPVAGRIAAAEALGRGGDPRLGNLDETLIEVPGCPGESLGKYPVTVEEYQRFLSHRGYQESDYWSADGWAARERWTWDEPYLWGEQLATPNRCAVGVSWYEAQAYCSWLSALTGKKVRLPSENTWQAAATPEDGRYPWGAAEPDEEKANFASRWCRPDVGCPTPVGAYPAGDGPWGHSDLAGNVWEWCAESWLDSETVKVLRGGCWSYSKLNLRSTSRCWYPATHRSQYVGFRVVAISAELDA